MFNSDRSGYSEWVANRDGSRASQLTNFEGGGRVASPSCSAEGTRIAFDATLTGTSSWNLYAVAAVGGVYAADGREFNNIWPSWSPDGRCIYFRIQTHHRPANLEDAIGRWDARADYHHGGLEPIVSPDGRIYYAKAPPVQDRWEVPRRRGSPDFSSEGSGCLTSQRTASS